MAKSSFTDIVFLRSASLKQQSPACSAWHTGCRESEAGVKGERECDCVGANKYASRESLPSGAKVQEVMDLLETRCREGEAEREWDCLGANK